MSGRQTRRVVRNERTASILESPLMSRETAEDLANAGVDVDDAFMAQSVTSTGEGSTLQEEADSLSTQSESAHARKVRKRQIAQLLTQEQECAESMARSAARMEVIRNNRASLTHEGDSEGG